jgi:hypothetical protein
MSGTWAQLRALVGLRWSMVRSRRVRAGLLIMGGAVAGVVVSAIAGARLLPTERAGDVLALSPSAYFGYAMLAVVGPIAAGGGNEMFPWDELAPHPIRPATVFVSSLLLSPLNVAWTAQTGALLVLASYDAGSARGLPAALGLTLLFVAAATVAGQAIAWGVAGARQLRAGRIALWLMAAALVAAASVAMHVGLTNLLDRAPTRSVVLAVRQGAFGEFGRWPTVVSVLAAVLALGATAGVRTTSFALMRPRALAHARQARPVRRRSTPARVTSDLRTLGRAAIWRAPALRRGVLVMGLLPGFACAAARIEWRSLGFTAGLVTAGAGLLFGVNAFCLDGGGALWLGSQPLSPRAQLIARAWITAEVCLTCAALCAVAGATRARGEFTTTEGTAVAATVVACTLVVVATCMRSSVTRPHRADLLGPRDTPVPHGAMAVHSTRLAVQTTLTAVFVSTSAAAGSPIAPVLAAVVVAALAGVSLSRTLRKFADPGIRAHVLVTVATG